MMLCKPPDYEFTVAQAIELLLSGPETKGPTPFTFTLAGSGKINAITHHLRKTMEWLRKDSYA